MLLCFCFGFSKVKYIKTFLLIILILKNAYKITISSIYCPLLRVKHFKNLIKYEILLTPGFNNLFRHLGVQLFPFTSLRGMINLLFNVLLYFTACTVVFRSPLLNGSGAVTILKQVKPFFGFFFQLMVGRLYPASTMVTFFYYLFNGQRIINLLDSDSLRGLPIDMQPVRYSALLFLGNTFTVIVVNMGNLISLFNNGHEMTLFQTISKLVCLYILSTIAYFHYFLIYYLEHSTIEKLLQMKGKLTGKLTKIQENSLISQLLELVKLNRQVYSHITLQLFIFYFIASINSLVIFYLVFFLIPYWALLAIPLINAGYTLYLVDLNRQILLLAEEIMDNLNAKDGAQVLVRIPQVHYGPHITPQVVWFVVMSWYFTWITSS